MTGAALDALLLPWFERARRDLPWRRTRDPYAIWVSEMMLQQTRVETVLRYYDRFLARFPTFAALAEAPLDDVLKMWEGMGYYSRARNMHRAARAMAMTGVPRGIEDALRVPGMGRYSAGAVLSIAYGLPHPALDGNVKRVLSRLFAEGGDPRRADTQRRLWAHAEALMTQTDPSAHNQALIELGAVVCKPVAPACEACPLASRCRARAEGDPSRYPPKAAKPPLPEREIAAAIVEDGPRFLLRRRPERGLLGGLWELPGEERLPNESLADACTRAARSAIDGDVHVGDPLPTVKHTFTHFRLRLHPFRCRPQFGSSLLISHAAPAPEFGSSLLNSDLRWVTMDEAGELALPRAQQRALQHLREALGVAP